MQFVSFQHKGTEENGEYLIDGFILGMWHFVKYSMIQYLFCTLVMFAIYRWYFHLSLLFFIQVPYEGIAFVYIFFQVSC